MAGLATVLTVGAVSCGQAAGSRSGRPPSAKRIFGLAMRRVLHARTVREDVWYRLVGPPKYRLWLRWHFVYRGSASPPLRYLDRGQSVSLSSGTMKGPYRVAVLGSNASFSGSGCSPAWRPVGAPAEGATVLAGLPGRALSVRYLGSATYQGRPAWRLRVEYKAAPVTIPESAVPKSGRVSGDLLVSQRSHLPLHYQAVTRGQDVDEPGPFVYTGTLRIVFDSFRIRPPSFRGQRACLTH